MNELRSALQKLIKETGLSQVSIYEATGVTQSSLSQFLSGKRSGINGNGALKLAKFVTTHSRFQESAPPRDALS